MDIEEFVNYPELKKDVDDFKNELSRFKEACKGLGNLIVGKSESMTAQEKITKRRVDRKKYLELSLTSS